VTSLAAPRWFAFAVALALAFAFAGNAFAQAAAVGDPGALARLPLQPRNGQGVAVQVLDRDGRPCGDAVLAALPGRTGLQWRARVDAATAAFPGDPVRQAMALLLQHGRRFAVAADGSATLPEGEPLAVYAFAGDDCATAFYRPRDGAVRLRLAPPRQLRAVVTTADGRPAAGVPVGIVSAANTWLRTYARTDADGACTIDWSALDAPLEPMVVRVLAATRQPVEQPPPDGAVPARLQLPPTGSVRVVLQGRVADPAPRFALRLETQLDRRIGARVGTVRVPPVEAGAREARFEFVEAGIGATAEIATPGMVTPVGVAVPPVVAGRETTVTIDLGAGPPRLAFRLRDVAGRPLADTELHVAWVRALAPHGFDAATAADGALEFDVDEACTPDGALVLEQHNAEGETVAAAEVPLLGIGPGRNDRGELRMQELPLLAAGRVVDVRGAPVAGVVVEKAGGSGFRHSEHTRADGAFAVRGRAPVPAEVQLRIAGGDWFLAPAMDQTAIVPGGTTDCVLRVERAGHVLVRFAPPIDAGCASVLRVQAVQHDGDGRHETTIAVGLPELVLPAGRWDLTLQLEGQEVATFADVVVDPGVEAHDARLMRLDWRAFAALATIEVVGPDGQPTDACEVVRRWGSPGHLVLDSRPPHAGKATLLVPKEGVEIVVEPKDRKLATAVVGLVTGGGHAVRLQPRPNVQLKLVPKPVVPAGSTLELQFVDAPTVFPRPADEGTGRLAAERDGTFAAITRPGERKLVVYLRTGDRTVPIGPPLTIEIRADGGLHLVPWSHEQQQILDQVAPRREH
jgi:hypothetical protein